MWTDYSGIRSVTDDACWERCVNHEPRATNENTLSLLRLREQIKVQYRFNHRVVGLDLLFIIHIYRLN